MAGSHRAPRKTRSSSAVPRWALAVAIVVALIPAAYFTAHGAFHDSSSPQTSTTDLPIPPVTPSTTITTGSPTPSPTPTRTAAARPHLTKVATDAPRRITSGRAIDSGFDSSVTDLDASSDAEVARWDPRGSPGSPGTDTVYVIGRVLANGDGAFSGLPDLERGSKVSIRTDSGTMTYTVSATSLMVESGLAKDPLFGKHHAGRLVLVGIRYDASGDRLGKALVVTAQLSAAKKA